MGSRLHRVVERRESDTRRQEGLKEAREQIARMINAESEEDLIFTSGGTESSNLAIKGFAMRLFHMGRDAHVVAVCQPSVPVSRLSASAPSRSSSR